MTGDIKIEITITAETIDRILSLLGIKETREEKKEASPSPIPPTPSERKEESKENTAQQHTRNNISNNIMHDVDAVAINPAIPHNAASSANVIYPPTRDEVAEYIQSKGYLVDANRFYTYYSRLGWCNKAGVSIIAHWKETLDSWTTNGNSNMTTPIGMSSREVLKATHPFIPTEF